MNDGKGDVWVEAGLTELAPRGSRVSGSRCSPRSWASPRAASTAASPTVPHCSMPCWNAGARADAAIAQQTRLDGARAPRAAEAVIQLYSERLNPEGMAIELAIRQWARSDEGARRSGRERGRGAAASTSPSFIARPASRPRRPRRRPSCSIASSSARACCSSSAVRANARSSWRSRPRSCWIKQ